MKGYVYLITRSDGQKYVGITIDVKKRMSAHRKSERFASGIKNVTVLKECNTYEEAELLEAEYIKEYDTFNNGLNKSIDGKGNHLAPNFNTNGYKFSEKSRQKMKDNHWSTKMEMAWKTEHSNEQKEKWSKMRKGKCWGPRKIPVDKALEIIDSYENNKICFENDFILQFVKKLDKDKVGIVPLEELKAPNGKYLNRIKLYSEYYAKKFNVTPTAIRGLLQNGIAN